MRYSSSGFVRATRAASLSRGRSVRRRIVSCTGLAEEKLPTLYRKIEARFQIGFQSVLVEAG